VFPALGPVPSHYAFQSDVTVLVGDDPGLDLCPGAAHEPNASRARTKTNVSRLKAFSMVKTFRVADFLSFRIIVAVRLPTEEF
jgi:hypothetical protein